MSLNEELKVSLETSLVSLIHYSDHASMGHSIESRMPFLDFRLVEFLAEVPACYKMHNGWTKYLARLAFDKKLPDDICWRKDKMGWPIPEEYWFKGNLKTFLFDTVNSSSLCLKLDGKASIRNWSEPKGSIEAAVRRLNLAVFEKLFMYNGK